MGIFQMMRNKIESTITTITNYGRRRRNKSRILTLILLFSVVFIVLNQLPLLKYLLNDEHIIDQSMIRYRAILSTDNNNNNNNNHNNNHDHNNNNNNIKIINNNKIKERPKQTKVPQVYDFLDFAIVGFPKCASTFLLSWLDRSNQTFTGGNGGGEVQLLQKNKLEEFVQLYDRSISSISSNSKTTAVIRNGYKDPGELTREVSLQNLAHHFPKTKLIVSVRHPVLWYESLYNFRLNGLERKKRMNNEKKNMENENNCIKGYGLTCTGGAKFHVFLSRLGWTPMMNAEQSQSRREMDLLGHHTLSVHDFKHASMFLMEVGQLGIETMEEEMLEAEEVKMSTAEGNTTTLSRSTTTTTTTTTTVQREKADRFVNDIENYLGLEGPTLERFRIKKKKITTVKGSKGSKDDTTNKHFNICETKYINLRHELLKIGKNSSQWIIDYFIKSSHVFVSNEEHFVELVKRWDKDPCKMM